MAVLCGMPTVQYSAGRGPLSVHKLFTSCIRQCLVSRAWVMAALSAVLLKFSVSNSVCFYSMLVNQTAQWRNGLLNIRHRTLPKIWVGFLYGAYSPGELFWIDSNGKMETRHPAEGSFGREFPAICNYCVVMAAWSRKTLKC